MNHQGKIHMAKLAAGMLLFAAAGGTVRAAQEMPDMMLPETVVTATRTENTVQQVPASTQVITAEEIAQSGAGNLRQVLEAYTNIMQKYRTKGGGHDVIIRGMDTDKSLILINGQRAANEADAAGLGTAMALDRINMNEVERIEIVRGPSSALYGSEAMGGVINIITRLPARQGVSAGYEVSSEDRSNWWRFDTGRHGKLAASLDMRFNKIKRDMDSDDVQSNRYGTAQDYHFQADYYISDRQTLSLDTGYYSQHLKSDTGESKLKYMPVMMGSVQLHGYAQIAGGGTADYKQKNAGLIYRGHSDRNDWQIKTYYSQFDWNSSTQNQVIDAVNGNESPMDRAYAAYVRAKYNTFDFNRNKHKLYAAEARDSLKIGEGQRLTFGAEYMRDKVSGTNLGANGDQAGSITVNGVVKAASKKEIDTYAAYIQDEITHGKWFIVPAFRYDHHGTFGSHGSPKLGITYNVRNNLRIKANYGAGFKAPSVYQLYYYLYQEMGQNNWVTLIGNPDLKPEESKSYDIGFEVESGKAYGSLTWFDSRVKNLIESVQISGLDKTYKYMNIGRARMKGVENTLGYRFNDRWQMKVMSAWLDAENRETNAPLPKRSRLSQVWQISYDDGKDNGYSIMLWEDVQYHYRAENGRVLSYGLFNGAVTKKINKNSRMYASLQNIGNKKDDDADLNGRFWLVGWEHQF
jgi:outer membrane receptor for ferrienterochelin and colicins